MNFYDAHPVVWHWRNDLIFWSSLASFLIESSPIGTKQLCMMRCLNHCLSCVCVCAAEAISRWHSICPQYYCWHWCGTCIWATLFSQILFHGLSFCGFICFQIAHEILTIRWRSDALWVILIRLWLLYYLQSVVLEICLQSHRYWNTHQDLAAELSKETAVQLNATD